MERDARPAVDGPAARREGGDGGGGDVEEGEAHAQRREDLAVARVGEPRVGGARRRGRRDGGDVAAVGAHLGLHRPQPPEAQPCVAEVEEALTVDDDAGAAGDGRAERLHGADDERGARLAEDREVEGVGRLRRRVAVEHELDRRRLRRVHLDGGRRAARLVRPEDRRRRAQLERRPPAARGADAVAGERRRRAAPSAARRRPPQPRRRASRLSAAAACRTRSTRRRGRRSPRRRA